MNSVSSSVSTISSDCDGKRMNNEGMKEEGNKALTVRQEARIEESLERRDCMRNLGP